MPSANKSSKQDAEQPTLLQRLHAFWMWVPGGALLFAVVPLILLSYLGWYYYGAEHLDQAFYAVRKENVLVTPQPPWIKQNVLDQVFEKAGLDRLSLLDPTTSAVIAQAFDANPWIKSTTRVTKSVGGKIAVDVVYRRPLAMVYYEPKSTGETPLPNAPTDKGFFPVDATGITLPSKENFDASDLEKYFLVFADAAAPRGDAGQPFGDQRITEALRVCEFLEAKREELRLQRVYVEQNNQLNGRSNLVFVLITTDLHQIRWGHAPQAEGVGEPSPEQKLNKITEWLAQQRESTNAAAQLDLLSMTRPVSFR